MLVELRRRPSRLSSSVPEPGRFSAVDIEVGDSARAKDRVSESHGVWVDACSPAAAPPPPPLETEFILPERVMEPRRLRSADLYMKSSVEARTPVHAKDIHARHPRHPPGQRILVERGHLCSCKVTRHCVFSVRMCGSECIATRTHT